MWPWVSNTKPVPVPPSPLVLSASMVTVLGRDLAATAAMVPGLALHGGAAGVGGDGGGVAVVVVVLGQGVAEATAQAAGDQRGDQDRGDQPTASATGLLGRGLLLVRGAPAAVSVPPAPAVVSPPYPPTPSPPYAPAPVPLSAYDGVAGGGGGQAASGADPVPCGGAPA
jgi:hypothetical protein